MKNFHVQVAYAQGLVVDYLMEPDLSVAEFSIGVNKKSDRVRSVRVKGEVSADKMVDMVRDGATLLGT